MDSRIFSCDGCGRLRFSEDLRARRFEPVGKGIGIVRLHGELLSITCLAFVLHALPFFFFVLRASQYLRSFKAVVLTMKEIRF